MSKVLKTIGFELGYVIVMEDGFSHRVMREGNKWELHGESFKSLGDVKKYVESCDETAGWSDEKRELVETGLGQAANGEFAEDPRPRDEDAVLMSCVPPADLLVLVFYGGASQPEKLVTEIEKSLNEFGRLNEDGSPDIDYANKSFQRVRPIED